MPWQNLGNGKRIEYRLECLQLQLAIFQELQTREEGSGHAGSCAALSAVEHGCQRGWVGGNGYFTAGAHRTVHGGLRDLLSIVQNVPSPEAIERIDMDPYTRDDFVGDVMRLGNGKPNPVMVDALVDNSRAAIEWLAKSVKVPFVFSFNRQAYEVNGRQKFWGGMVLSVADGGKGLIAAHRRALKEAGVQVWFNTPALSLVMSDGKVSGLQVRKEGVEVTLQTRSVILASGGFEANAKLREKYLGPGWAHARIRGTPYNTGDGFALAKAVGARFSGDWAGCHSTAWDANADAEAGQRDLTNQYTKSGYPLGIMINSDGVRFVDEGEDYRNYTYAKFGRAILEQPGGFAFQIWDSRVIASLRKEEYGDGVVEKVFAPTLEELADKLGERGLVNKTRLMKTLKEYNEAVQFYQDENPSVQWDPAVKDGLSTQSTGKQLSLPKSNWALAIDTPPFMAVKVACGITFTFGGLAIDPESSAVISEDGNGVLEGIFCTGEMVGDLFFDNYPGGSGLTAGARSTPYILLMSFAGLVQQVTAAHREAKPGPSTNSTKTLDDENLVRSGRQSNGDRALPLSPATIAPFAPDSPSTRTGPPRSLSYTYSLSSLSTPTRSRNNPDLMSPDGMPKTPLDNLDGFRSALDLDQLDRKGKRKESRTVDEGRSPMKWLHDSPREEKAGFDFDSTRYGRQTPPCITIQTPDGKPERTGSPNHPKSASTIDSGYKLESPLDRRTLNPRRTLPTSNDQAEARSGRVGNRWSMIRSLIPHIGSQDKDARTSGPSAVTSNKVNITDELITGGLSTLMLRLWFERDEKDHRRIPILFHRLRIRVSDSLHPMHKQKTVFRIECEYANGATRWVIYRTMRDFLSLHAHYQLSNVYKRNVEKIPEFPRHALPYLKFLKKEGREVGSANFALLQRESLENYLIELIRAVMFHPSSNRLAGFLEISALSISMAQSGGSQYKAGYLDIASEGVGGGFGRRSAGWRARKSSKWCAIRESYLVVMEEPGELNVWDVFLLDPDFEIERPKRYYRQGLHLLHVDGFVHSDKEADNTHISDDAERRSMIDSVTAKISKFFHAEDKRRADPDNTMLGQHEGSIHSLESEVSQAPPPMLDPSTNINPLISKEDEHPPEGKDYSEDVSKHTFYITNAQMRLRLFARTERQMLQWITAFEKVAASSHYTGKNRFDSFAPIRLNVAAQWLVDGRDYFWNLSRAILLAHESIYIHDWWLSPGTVLYLSLITTKLSNQGPRASHAPTRKREISTG
ncbi:hypothetical protein H0H93_001611 [Arthromyces matolae]|nr:hypothetical protein H0H93_001611 [Arthromyces matolae]